MPSSRAGSAQLERDIRSFSRPSKRDRDHREKWSMGMSPSPGVRINYVTGEAEGGSNETHRNKVVPKKQWSQMNSDPKSRRNAIPKASTSNVKWDQYRIFGRLTRKAEIYFEIQDHTSDDSDTESEIWEMNDLYISTGSGCPICDGSGSPMESYDGPRTVDLEGLVEQAERKWENTQTERMVKDEYEVLDNEGEITTVPSKAKGKRKGRVALKGLPVGDDSDDDFELI